MPGHSPRLGAVMPSKDLIEIAASDAADNDAFKQAFLGKLHHLLCEASVRIGGGVLRRIVQDALSCRWAFRHLNGILDQPTKHPKGLTVNIFHALPDASAQLGPGLVHGQKNTGDLQPGIEFLPYRPDHVQHIRDTFAGQEVRLNRDNTVIRCGIHWVDTTGKSLKLS